MDLSTRAHSTRLTTTTRPPATPAAASPKARRSARARAIPQHVPRLKSFAHIRSPKRRRALEYEQHLLILQALYPEYSTGLDDDLIYARSQSVRDSVSDRDRIMAQLDRVALSCREVSDDLSIPYPTTYKILQELAERGLLVIFERAGIAGNKPVCYYELPHLASLSLSL
jgi:hypothetical protein